MPVLSSFYGIVIRMFNESNVKHNKPHIHVEYQGFQAIFDFDGNVIDGNIPLKQKKMVTKWISLHKKELESNWKLICNGEHTIKILPLK